MLPKGPFVFHVFGPPTLNSFDSGLLNTLCPAAHDVLLYLTTVGLPCPFSLQFFSLQVVRVAGQTSSFTPPTCTPSKPNPLAKPCFHSIGVLPPILSICSFNDKDSRVEPQAPVKQPPRIEHVELVDKMPREPERDFRGFHEDIPRDASPGLRFAKAFISALDSFDPILGPESLDDFLAPNAVLFFKINHGALLNTWGYRVSSFPAGFSVLSIRSNLVTGYPRMAHNESTRDSPWTWNDTAHLDERMVIRLSTRTREYNGTHERMGAPVTDDILMKLVPAAPGQGFAGYQIKHLQMAFEH